jgi:hypothetical protein
VRRQLREEADQLVSSICGPLKEAAPVSEAEPASESAAVVTTAVIEVEVEDRLRFRRVYLDTIRPYLENPESHRNGISSASKSAEVFRGLHRVLPATVHPVIDDLESICEEERQLSRQRRIYHLLHGWLLAHVPLSIALLVLGGIHAIVAIQY